MPTQFRQEKWSNQQKEFMPFLFGRELKEEEIGKIDLFEKGLQNEIKKTDTIEMAITKVVKMALAAEFGASFVKAKGAQDMIATIVGGILSDTELRRQALLIIDKFAA